MELCSPILQIWEGELCSPRYTLVAEPQALQLVYVSVWKYRYTQGGLHTDDRLAKSSMLITAKKETPHTSNSFATTKGDKHTLAINISDG